MDTPNTRHPSHTPHPDPSRAKTPSFPGLTIVSVVFEKWGKIIGAVGGLLAVIGIVCGFAVANLETKAHAQQTVLEQTALQTKALNDAKADCEHSLKTALEETNKHLASLDLAVLSLQKDGAQQTKDAAAQYQLLQRMADKLNVVPVLVPSPEPSVGPPDPPHR